MDGDRVDVVRRASASRKASELGRWLGAAPHAVGLSVKIWRASAPITCARSTALTMPAASGQVRAQPAPVGKHRRHRTMRRWGPTMRRPHSTHGSSARSSATAGSSPSRPARSGAGVIYRYLRDQVFTEDRLYPEKEVNQRLALFHPDVATIRRGMVDAGLVTRDGRGVPPRSVTWATAAWPGVACEPWLGG